jgi:hypothetical protein
MQIKQDQAKAKNLKQMANAIRKLLKDAMHKANSGIIAGSVRVQAR